MSGPGEADLGRDPIRRANILGVEISAIDMSQAIGFLAGAISARARDYVCVVPAHTVMDCRRDPDLRAIVNAAGLATPDGMSIVWLLRLHGHRNSRRVYGPDLVSEACRSSAGSNWRHFFLGGVPGVADEMARRLAARTPGLTIVGTLSPPFRKLTTKEDDELVESVNRAEPDIVWVGLGSPKQERWMAEHRDRLNAPVLIGVGAAFDYISGSKRQAPRWIRQAGLEWLFRWLSEPIRLTPRYGRYPLFVLLAVAQAAGLYRCPSD